MRPSRHLCRRLSGLPGSHPKPQRATHLAAPHLHTLLPQGVGWLASGITRSVVETKNGPKLHPGMHGLDLRDWLLVDPETFAEQMGAKELALSTQSRRPEVLQISDAASLGAQ